MVNTKYCKHLKILLAGEILPRVKKYRGSVLNKNLQLVFQKMSVLI